MKHWERKKEEKNKKGKKKEKKGEKFARSKHTLSISMSSASLGHSSGETALVGLSRRTRTPLLPSTWSRTRLDPPLPRERYHAPPPTRLLSRQLGILIRIPRTATPFTGDAHDSGMPEVRRPEGYRTDREVIWFLSLDKAYLSKEQKSLHGVNAGERARRRKLTTYIHVLSSKGVIFVHVGGPPCCF